MCEDGVGTWRCGMWEKEDVCTRGREGVNMNKAHTTAIFTYFLHVR